MPDSMRSDELRRLKQIYPDPPYKTHAYNYSYFMGDLADGPKLAQQKASMRALVAARSKPILRLAKGEMVSKRQPYVFYGDSELDGRPPHDDSWPFQSYYYLMGHDEKGAVAIPRGEKVYVNIPSAELRGRGYVSMREVPRIPPARQLSRPTGTTSYVSLEGL